MNFLRQWMLLTTRTLRVFWAEKANCLWAIGQVPLMALLVIICFYGFSQEDPALDFFSRFTQQSQQYLDEQEQQGESVAIGKETAAKLYMASQIASPAIGVGTAQRRAAVHYLLISAAIWFGLMGASKEIAGERHILARESRSAYGVGAYLAAKFTVQVLIVGVQAVLLGVLTLPLLLKLSGQGVARISLLLWAVAVVAVCLGLLLSAGSNSVRAAMTWVPILMIPQFLFGGLLRPLALAGNEVAPPDMGAPARQVDTFVGVRSLAACFAMQRWGFDAALSMDEPYANGNVISMRYAWPEVGPDSPSWRASTLLRIVRYKEQSLANTILPATTPIDSLVGVPTPAAGNGMSAAHRFRRAAIALCTMSGVMLMATFLILKKRFR